MLKAVDEGRSHRYHGSHPEPEPENPMTLDTDTVTTNSASL
jgi:hypothetical protein